MKKVKFSLVIIIALTAFIGCNDKRHPNRVYMPDMAYSRAYEAYAQNNLQQEGINYLPYPVDGTIRRGDLFALNLPGDSTGYKAAVSLKSPIGTLDSIQMQEAQRLFLINCAICHGPKMDAQGPLAGKVGGIANLTVAQYVNEPEGQMYHVVTFGKGNMGSYASQLDRKQRWMVIQYVKSQQAKLAAPKASADSTKDSTAKK